MISPCNAVSTWSVAHIPPDQLLRQVFEECGTFQDARRRLETVPIARPAIFTLVGCGRGERCVIERTEEGFSTRHDATGAANDWLVPVEPWEARVGGDLAFTCDYDEAAENSRARRDALAEWRGSFARESFAWVMPPVLNKFTRLAAEMCPASGTLRVLGYELLDGAAARATGDATVRDRNRPGGVSRKRRTPTIHRDKRARIPSLCDLDHTLAPFREPSSLSSNPCPLTAVQGQRDAMTASTDREIIMATINGSSKNDRLHGSRFDDVINGFEGDDELNGYDGRDELNGGDGRDDLFGGGGSDVLNGGQGWDHLDGGTGADTMAGGLDGDLYYVDHVGDLVSEAKNEGGDSVYSMISYTLPSNVEVLWLQESTAAINGTGNGSYNMIGGNSRDNTLSGEGGDDMLKGGGGNDLLIGGSGNDHMDPGYGDMSADGMVGGLGNDIYDVSEVDDEVVENSNEGIDLVYASFDYTLGANVENLTLQGQARNGTGNVLDNVIHGNWDDDWLDGGDGNDTLYSRESSVTGGGSDRMIGGMGDDTFHLTGLDDQVYEWANQGTDRIVADTSYTLPQNVEILSLRRSSTTIRKPSRSTAPATASTTSSTAPRASMS